MLPPLSSDEEAELSTLDELTDMALRKIALEEMPEKQQARMAVLMEQNNHGVISAEAHAELVQLVELGQRLIVRKAKALALLAERGHA